MLTKDRLEGVLRELGVSPLDVRVEGDFGHFVGFLVSPAFRGVDEGARQARVWGHLLTALTDFERRDVEFVFTSTPEEIAALRGVETHA
ncbi:MAG: hypothetical protein IV100_21320 [Myxococcales bacterium]|nr:hypothetical protein [Myxococcales bacterium]